MGHVAKWEILWETKFKLKTQKKKNCELHIYCFWSTLECNHSSIHFGWWSQWSPMWWHLTHPNSSLYIACKFHLCECVQGSLFYGYIFFRRIFALWQQKKVMCKCNKRFFGTLFCKNSPYFEKNQILLPNLDITFMHHVSTKCDLKKIYIPTWPLARFTHSSCGWSLFHLLDQKKKEKKRKKKKKLAMIKLYFEIFHIHNLTKI
jgi:hypothetical protein